MTIGKLKLDPMDPHYFLPNVPKELSVFDRWKIDSLISWLKTVRLHGNSAAIEDQKAMAELLKRRPTVPECHCEKKLQQLIFHIEKTMDDETKVLTNDISDQARKILDRLVEEFQLGPNALTPLSTTYSNGLATPDEPNRSFTHTP